MDNEPKGRRVSGQELGQLFNVYRLPTRPGVSGQEYYIREAALGFGQYIDSVSEKVKLYTWLNEDQKKIRTYHIALILSLMAAFTGWIMWLIKP